MDGNYDKAWKNSIVSLVNALDLINLLNSIMVFQNCLISIFKC